jgi:hypothetical protein
LITACVGAFIGGLQGAIAAATFTGATIGIGTGIYGANHFFKPSAAEKQVQLLAAAAKDGVKSDQPHKENKQLDDGIEGRVPAL